MELFIDGYQMFLVPVENSEEVHSISTAIRLCLVRVKFSPASVVHGIAPDHISEFPGQLGKTGKCSSRHVEMWMLGCG